MIRCVLEPTADTEDMRGRLLQYAYDDQIDTEPLHFARGISRSGMLAHRTEESLVAEILQAAAHVDEDGRVLRAQRQQQRPLAALLQQHRLCERRVGVACV